MNGQLSKHWLGKFSVIWAGQSFSLFGSMLVQFALVWWLTAQTGSATVLAVATLVALLPTVFVGPLAGAFVDRSSRRMVMIVADSLVALTTLWLVMLYALGWMQIGHVYLAMFLRAAAGAFHWPAMQASTTLMVPKEHLARVGGLNQALMGLLSIVAPPAGALLVMTMPLHAVLAIDIATAALAVLPLCFLSIPQPTPAPADPNAPKTNLLEDVRVGLRYLRAWRGGMGMIAVAVVVKFFLNPAFALLPILTVKYFGGGALELGWMDAASGVGAVTGGVLLSVWGGFRRKIVTILIGLVGIGIGLLWVGITPASLLISALLGIAFSGLMGSLIDGPTFALLQSAVSPEMQGRVFTVFLSLISLTVPFGMIFGGLFADRVGAPALFVVAGIVCLVAAAFSFFSRDIMQLEENTPQTQPAPSAPVAAESV